MNIRFAIIDLSTAEIFGIVGRSDRDAASSTPNGCVAIELDPEQSVDSASHYLAGGILTAYTNSQFEIKSARPAHAATWSNASFAWVDNRTLNEIKADKWVFIKASRDVALNAPLVTPQGIFDSDLVSRANIAGAVALAQTLAAALPPFSITYTLANNTSVVLDAPGMVSVGLLLGAKVQAAFATARALRVRIGAAMSADDLDAITWPVS